MTYRRMTHFMNVTFKAHIAGHTQDGNTECLYFWCALRTFFMHDKGDHHPERQLKDHAEIIN